MMTVRSIGPLVFALTLLADRSEVIASEGNESILVDSRRLEEAVDQIVTNRMQKSYVPGAVVTLVKGNKIILNKGYGFANLEGPLPLGPYLQKCLPLRWQSPGETD